MILEYLVNNNKYTNIKQIAKEHFEMSERLIIKLKNKQLIFKNDLKAYINESVNLKDKISFNLDYDEDSDNIIPTQMTLDILYEDDTLLIINKPPFVPVHPSINHFKDSLANGIKYYFLNNNINKKIRPVNRLDKDTSGIVIFAKNEYIQECLIKQMKTNKFKKKYLAIIEGHFDEPNGTINQPIARKNGSIIEREVNINGQTAITLFNTLKTNAFHSLIEFELLTGRTHQIRVHASYLNHPLLGDSLYGKKSNLINRQALHCYKLEFYHPITQKILSIQSNIPTDMNII